MKEKRVKVFFELFVRKGGKSPFSGPFPHESEVQSEVLTSRIMGIIRLSFLECCELIKIFEVVRGRHFEPVRHFEGFLKGSVFVFASFQAQNRQAVRAVLSVVRQKKRELAGVRPTRRPSRLCSPLSGTLRHTLQKRSVGRGSQRLLHASFRPRSDRPSEAAFLNKNA